MLKIFCGFFYFLKGFLCLSRINSETENHDIRTGGKRNEKNSSGSSGSSSIIDNGNGSDAQRRYSTDRRSGAEYSTAGHGAVGGPVIFQAQ